ncbi:MAG: excinuclease ABC subunit UvrC [Dehalococcoidia bacterium]
MLTPSLEARTLPDKPGVYLFYDTEGMVIYVGKASSLRNRVKSYFASRPLSPKVQMMVPAIAGIDFILAGSDQEALILESNLIKRHKPRYNVRLKDDKSYPYLKITLAEKWPRVHVTRRLREDGSRYFGPYASGRSLRQTIDLMNKLFKYRTCKKSINGIEDRPCLMYHINRCAAPCIGEVSESEYREIIQKVILFLEGKQDRVIRQLRRQMQRASREMEFEKAAALRDQVRAIESVMEQQKAVSSRKLNNDVIAIAPHGNTALAQVFFVRNGKLIGKEHFSLEGATDETAGKVTGSFIEQFYSAGAQIPPEILIQEEPEDKPIIKSWLEARRGSSIRLVVPRRGEKRQLLEMAAENAVEAMQQMQLKWLADEGKTGAALKELRDVLGLPEMPKRIECYDISSLQGTSAVGSMVVFEEGRPRTGQYRRFKIKTVGGADDYAMMREVLRRRFRRVGKSMESNDETGWVSPDLLIIDGGRGHLNIAVQAMREMGMGTVPVASIAKENEDVFIPQRTAPLEFERNSPAHYLLQRIRDEAHRFAVSYHTKVRKKGALKSRLDSVPGIGPKRRRALVRRFGSVKGIREASVDELASVPGMNHKLAANLKEFL